MDVSVILPTYNERENITKLIPMIAEVLRNYRYEIIVVDDNSPDGTAEIALKLAEKYPVKVIKRPSKLGLTSAIYEGISNSSGKYIVIMDADLQHPPEVIPSLIMGLERCDLVVASRYVKGGMVTGFPIHRRLISRVSILLTHILVERTRAVKDPVSGFFSIRREHALKWKPLVPAGYKALVEIIGSLIDLSICEEPYVFRTRPGGRSKLSLKVILAYIVTLAKLRPLRFAMLCLLAIILIAVILYISL
ncbi:MAG: polyprenol monophosphomannose synthase [Desulfurococcaceae archaeon]